jgi:uncharacterized protein YecE (DUF72 family)
MLHIGISGWAYAGWRGRFYPEGLPQRRELEYASRAFSSVEINGTFYSLQTPSSYQRWYGDTPENFCFAVKGSRFITHVKRLQDMDNALPNFFASGLLCLQEKLGPILWQLPASFRFDEGRLERFFRALPRNAEQATEVASRHDERLKGQAWTLAQGVSSLRYALEARHESFGSTTALDLLRQFGVALVVSDGAGQWPMLEEVTASFVYVRLHGSRELYASGYSDEELDCWAERIRTWQSAPGSAHALDVYVYFDNDADAHAPFDALALAQRIAR